MYWKLLEFGTGAWAGNGSVSISFVHNGGSADEAHAARLLVETGDAPTAAGCFVVHEELDLS